MRRKDFLTYLLLGALLAAAVTFIWNYKTTIPWITERISPALLPVFGGVCIGFIMNLPASFFEKHIKRCRIECLSKHSMGLALLISILLLLVFIGVMELLVLTIYDEPAQSYLIYGIFATSALLGNVLCLSGNWIWKRVHS